MNYPLFAVYGASGCGRGVMPLAREQLIRNEISIDHLVFIDDQPEAKKVNGHYVLTYSEFLNVDASEKYVVIAIANSVIRERLAVRCAKDEVRSWNVIAMNTMIMDDVKIDEGAVISPFVTITSNIRIGRYFHANLYSYVEHDCTIGDFVTFAPGVKCNGNIIIEDHAYVGTGAIIKHGKPGQPLVIGRSAIIGMGAVVTKNVMPGAVVVGNPAKLIKKAQS